MICTLFLDLEGEQKDAPWPEDGLADYIDEIKQTTVPGLVELDTMDNVRRIRVMYDDARVGEPAVLAWLGERGLRGRVQ